jgi:hypothetical protein
MPRTLVAPALLLAALAVAPAAHADVLSLRAEALGGGMGGIGITGEQATRDAAFFAERAGPGYGALVGAEVFYVDAWVSHLQFPRGATVGTWTTFGLGIDLDHVLRKPAPVKKGVVGVGKQTGYLEAGVSVTYCVGTGQQVEPPLDASELSDRGFALDLRFGAGFTLAGGLSLGVALPISGGYFFKQGFANDESTHYTSVQAGLLLVARGKLTLR